MLAFHKDAQGLTPDSVGVEKLCSFLCAPQAPEMMHCLSSGNSRVCVRRAKVSRQGKEGMSEIGLRRPRES